MNTNTYSPFDNSLSDLQTKDLQNLKHASEGWYIEYKSEVPNASALAKSISAFANTYGGWLFLGVLEESKENSVAGTFPGINREHVDSTLQRIRKSAADLLNPTPHFEIKVLWGPEASIGLNRDSAIICAWIPQSTAAPHVHKSGRIYRRVSDSSEPRAENDRYILDQLWRRADDLKKNHEKWYEKDPEFSEAETEVPFVRLMLIADPWMIQDVWLEANENKVRAALEETSGVSSIPFDNVYTSSRGFIGRQLRNNDVHNLTLTWKLYRDLVSDVIVPLPLHQPTQTDELGFNLVGYKHSEQFINILDSYKISTLRIVDLNFLFNILLGVVEIQERLCRLADWTGSYFFKIKLLNFWRTIPYIDVPEIMERFRLYGPPMCLDSISSFPSGTGPENYIEVKRYNSLETDIHRFLIQAITMFSSVAILFGIPNWFSYDQGSDVTPFHQSLYEAGIRALEKQRIKNSGK